MIKIVEDLLERLGQSCGESLYNKTEICLNSQK